MMGVEGQMSLPVHFVPTETPVSSGAVIYSLFRPGHASDRYPLLLTLHGYPQNSSMFFDLVKYLPADYGILLVDLPGYGKSTKPPSADGSSLAHSKREWAKDIIELCDKHPSNIKGQKIIAYGHDRGARLAYRMALDFPERVVGLAVLDIVPTPYMWDQMSLDKGFHAETHASSHWIFLSTKRPVPETLISTNAEFYFKYTLEVSAGAHFTEYPQWLQDSIEPYLQGEKSKDLIVAVCEDYRAGATHDLHFDLASGINPSSPATSPIFNTPVLVLSSTALQKRFPVNEIWNTYVPSELLRGHRVGETHMFPNLCTEETAERTKEWLKEFWG